MRSVELNNVQFLSVVMQKAEFKQTLLALTEYHELYGNPDPCVSG